MLCWLGPWVSKPNSHFVSSWTESSSQKLKTITTQAQQCELEDAHQLFVKCSMWVGNWLNKLPSCISVLNVKASHQVMGILNWSIAVWLRGGLASRDLPHYVIVLPDHMERLFSIVHLYRVWFVVNLLLYIWCNIILANLIDPNQLDHNCLMPSC